MRIQGILLPADWNDDGQVTALILATSDEAEIQIKTDRSLEKFQQYLRRKVIVDGDLATSGFLMLKAISFLDAEPFNEESKLI